MTENSLHQSPAGLASARGLVWGDELREIFDALDHGLCIVETQFDDSGRCVDYVFMEINGSFERQTGLVDAVGRSMRTLRPDHEEHWFEIYGGIARTGTPRRFAAPAAALGRWYDVYAFRVGEPAMNRVAILFEDITEKKQREERYTLLNREIEHRSRNLFAMFEGLVRLTREDNVEAFKAILLRRTRALFASSGIGGEVPASGADFSELARHEMEAYQSKSGRRIALSGPSVPLDQTLSSCLSMILHELATNALKYGALSVPQGSVSLSWTIDADMLRIHWKEVDGPPVEKPARKGLGSTVIERCVGNQLGGKISARWERAGVEYELTVPLEGGRGLI